MMNFSRIQNVFHCHFKLTDVFLLFLGLPLQWTAVTVDDVCDDGSVGCLSKKLSILKSIPYINVPGNLFLLCYHCANKFLEKSTVIYRVGSYL